MLEFEKEEILMLTPCKHAFHQECLMKWVNKHINSTLSELTNHQLRTEIYQILKEKSPVCPNCNWHLIKKAEEK